MRLKYYIKTNKMKRLRISPILLFVTLFVFTACSNMNGNDYKTSESGLQYRFHEENSNENQAKINDIVHVKMKYTINDSVIFDSDKLKQQMRFPLIAPIFPGDFYEGIAQMHKGDSASFLCPADRIFLEVFRVRELPAFVKEGDMMRFDIRLIDFLSPEAYEAEQYKKKAEQIAESESMLQAFLDQENIKVLPTGSGLYYVELERGKGPQPQKGQKVKVHYAGRLTNGLPFDDSYSRGRPLEFELGAGRDEGIAMMREGGRAMLIIPYHLAYGERETGKIPAYSPLVFEVELVEVIK
jgi:FKBP-type peptidyl-prolyl cis-trans isomerase